MHEARPDHPEPMSTPTRTQGAPAMLKALDRSLRRSSRPMVIVMSVLLVGAVAALDDATGFELSFSIFYLIPVSLAAWYLGRKIGQTISVLSALAWLAVDITAGNVYSSPAIPFWNAMVRLGFFVLVATLLANLRHHMQREEMLARVDGLTGALTGSAFRQSAAEIIGLAARNGKPFILAYVDLDDFKRVNDTRGHAEGDRVLKTVVSALMDSVRRTDVVGRLGGDEFAVLLPETDEVGAREVVEKIRNNLADAAETAGFPIGASIGAAVFLEPPGDPDEAIARADELMYRAKRSHKNSTIFFEVPAPASPGFIRSQKADAEP